MCLSKFSEEKISYIKMLIDKLSYSEKVYLSLSEKIIFLTMPILRLFVSCRYKVVKGLCSTFFFKFEKDKRDLPLNSSNSSHSKTFCDLKRTYT